MSNLIECSDCNQMISKSAKICPNCGKKQTTHGCGIILGLIAIIFVVFYFLASNSSNTTTPSEWSDDTKILVLNYAQRSISKALKSPSSAEFPTYLEVPNQVNYGGNKKYYIKSYVDSDNSFGAKMRTHYTMIVLVENNTMQVIEYEIIE